MSYALDNNPRKPVLMIHELREWMFDLPLENYILTFDDGLYSQYYFLEKLLKFKTLKYFFVSTNIVCPEDAAQCDSFPGCNEAHELFFNKGDKKHYMKWSQIHEINSGKDCIIGGHSHYHRKHEDKSLRILYKDLMEDTKSMAKKFKEQRLEVDSFCYPYNVCYPLYQGILEKCNMKYFFGTERVPIEDLKSSCKRLL